MASNTIVLAPQFGKNRRGSLLAVVRSGSIPISAFVTIYLSAIVLLPLIAIVTRAFSDGGRGFLGALSAPDGYAAMKLTILSSLGVALINVMMGTLIAWVLVRDDFPMRGTLNALIDLPFALPTIVAGLTLLALYGQGGPFGINIAYTQAGVFLALLFVTLPFVVRSVQPVLLELDREMEEAAQSLGAAPSQTFARIILPALYPALISGGALAFARAMGEFGALVLISGNIPFKTQVASVYIFGQIESGNQLAAAATATVLLAISIGVLLLLNGVQRWVSKHAQ